MKRFKNYILITIIIFSSNALYAVPGTYYNSIDTNKTCAALKTALFQLLSSNTTISIPYSLVDDYFDKTDLKAAKSPQTGLWFLIDIPLTILMVQIIAIIDFQLIFAK